MQWHQVLTNPALKNLPFKIELDRLGQLLMSPASNAHGAIQADLAAMLKSKFKQRGRVYSECSIQTQDGVRVADVASVSDTFVAAHADATPFPSAPELCVEIVSPSNSKAAIAHKVQLYFAQGAQEVWVVSLKRVLAIYADGKLAERSRLVSRIAF
jgi:Uma2 family endonuclease